MHSTILGLDYWIWEIRTHLNMQNEINTAHFMLTHTYILECVCFSLKRQDGLCLFNYCSNKHWVLILESCWSQILYAHCEYVMYTCILYYDKLYILCYPVPDSIVTVDDLGLRYYSSAGHLFSQFVMNIFITLTLKSILLRQWDMNKMADILQTAFWNAFTTIIYGQFWGHFPGTSFSLPVTVVTMVTSYPTPNISYW